MNCRPRDFTRRSETPSRPTPCGSSTGTRSSSTTRRTSASPIRTRWRSFRSSGTQAGRRGLSHALEDRGDDPLREAVLRFRAHPRHVLRKLEEHVRDRPRDDLLHRRVARSRREEGHPRRAHRAHAPEIQRDAGVLPRCARCRNQAGVRALRKLGDESRGQEEGRQTYPPPKASRRDWLQGVPTLPGWDELSYLGVG